MDKDSRIVSKLDKVMDHISAIDVTLAAQHEVLKSYVKRTEDVEKRVASVEKQSSRLNGLITALMSVGVLGIITKLLRG